MTNGVTITDRVAELHATNAA